MLAVSLGECQCPCRPTRPSPPADPAGFTMPTYEYRCTTCHATFDVEQSFRDDPLTRCPTSEGPEACTAPGEGQLKKLFSAVGISFKGSGFYKNDSRSSSGSGSSGSKKSSTSESSSTPSGSDSAKGSTSGGGSSSKDSSSSASAG